MRGPLLFASWIDSYGDGGREGGDVASVDLGSLPSCFEKGPMATCRRPLPIATEFPILKGGLIRNVRLLLFRVSGSSL